jgi:hypothetical protein
VKVFLSWSGDASKYVATVLRDWLRDVIQSLEPWISSEDIDAGARWSVKIQGKLQESAFGIICLTPSNLEAPWILFEAGALAKTVEETFVCPYLIGGLKPADIPGGPLAQFQANTADKAGTLRVILTLNKALKEKALDDEQVRRAFERCWPELEDKLNKLPDLERHQPERSERSILEEVLDVVRGLSRKPEWDILAILDTSDPNSQIRLASQEALSIFRLAMQSQKSASESDRTLVNIKRRVVPPEGRLPVPPGGRQPVPSTDDTAETEQS